MTPDFHQKLLSMRPDTPRTVALANATDVHALQSLVAAHKMGFANAILCGNEHAIRTVAAANEIDISQFSIVDCANEIDAAHTAVSLVRNGQADILMKGLIHSADFLRAVLNRDTGIRGDGILSHVSVLYSPSQKRTLFLTDIAMVMYPDLHTKLHLIRNAVNVATHFGVALPRVATLCAVETLNPAMQATVDAAALRDMNTSGEISGCVLSGPISFDLAISESAAVSKGYSGPVAGNADILVFDDIDAGNNTIKAMVHFGDWIFGGVIVGARCPIVLNSRSDSDVSKLFSIACACTM